MDNRTNSASLRDRLNALLRNTRWVIVAELLLVILATEEAILNSMVAAEDMTGHKGFSVRALPHEALRDVMRRYGRLA